MTKFSNRTEMISAILSKVLFVCMRISNGTKIISKTKQRYDRSVKNAGIVKISKQMTFSLPKGRRRTWTLTEISSIFQVVDYYSTYAHKRIAVNYNESASLIARNRMLFLALRHVKTRSSCTMTHWKLPSIFYENEFWICICKKTVSCSLCQFSEKNNYKIAFEIAYSSK